MNKHLLRSDSNVLTLYTLLHILLLLWLWFIFPNGSINITERTFCKDHLTNNQNTVHSITKAHIRFLFCNPECCLQQMGQELSTNQNNIAFSALLVNSFISLAPFLCLEPNTLPITQTAAAGSQPGLSGHKGANLLYIFQA